MARTRRTFTPEFKADAVRLVPERARLDDAFPLDAAGERYTPEVARWAGR